MSQANTKILFLDDSQERANAFLKRFPNAVWVTSSSEAIAQLSSSKWDIVCLDHDLGEVEVDVEDYLNGRGYDDGMKVVDWIMTYYPVIKRIYVHSNNYPAATRMRSTLQAGGYSVLYMPFSSMLTFISV